MRVRQATESDVEGFVAVHGSVAAERVWILTEPPVDPAVWHARLRDTLAAAEDTLFVLEDDDGAIVGNGGLHRTRAAGVATMGMSVRADARGRGGGRALLDAIVEQARADPDLHKLELEVYPENARAVSLYASAGFAVEGVRRNHYRRRDGTLRSVLLMALDVRAHPGPVV